MGYLPVNIPRILINRTIVHPSQPQDSCDDDDDDDGGGGGASDDDRDFREDYVFDAYLLGYCDDVTRALAKRLFPASGDIAEAKPRPEDEGVLLACVKDEEGIDGVGTHRKQDWTKSKIASKIPPERVFLFPGAVPPSDEGGSNGSANGDDASVNANNDTNTNTNTNSHSNGGFARYEEIAHCDGCARRVDDGIVHKCRTCFDYDLCPACYTAMASDHHEGTHEFVTEKVASSLSPSSSLG